ncbi:Solute-binding protein ABC transporter (MalE family) [Bifidobacterium actinocoloniiforme DSM 22766]|uniref:Solute-binding protein ABC transporter (MalE family) n=1 Tax=Bifidobacterium actinocoloniiforme DSM 22766 TaxID=1437605 RepID=A0A086YYB3_9BIFI|nr:ABC transporter substrate-binding protein [Bifidobacterium actinocoloniiforme]AKV55828.1 ABC transporter substrate-binding protein [Bifidobacterium actinocoloniiforme DSM 22766]KFI39263.1 Solute-binding protein ABC transporter (MalE family) [Bifidobacterium actinocoloniiforme DSM 22766]
MNTIVRVTAAVGALAMSLTGLSACGSSSASSDKGHVYYLSAKPEQQDEFKDLAKQFTKDTGIPVDVSVASSGTYEQSLKSELAKSNAPTMFDVDNNDFQNWGSYYADMSGTQIYKDLKKSEWALKLQDKVVAVPFVMERYGIIYNKALMKKYFDAKWSTVKSIKEVNNFKALKTVADEIQKHKDDIGVKGAFSSAGFDSSSSKRFGDQLAHIPVYYEYRDQHVTAEPPTLTGKYTDNFKQIFDLYITDATVEPTQLSSATMDDSNNEFASKQSVFLQNGSWGYPQIKGQEVPDEDIGVLPIYIGVPGEEKQGLTVSFMYFANNKNASAKDKEATAKFQEYILNNKNGQKIFTDDMGFETPFKSYDKAGFKSTNPVQRANDAYAKAGDYDTVIYPLPSAQWVASLSDAMLEYAQGTGKWSKVQTAFVDGWAKEYKTTH